MKKSKVAATRECPEGKEINPVSGRCVKICKEDEYRDQKTGKCVKPKRECPEGKEINPVTGRCVKICKEDEYRDQKTGKCVKKAAGDIIDLDYYSESSSPVDIELYYPDIKDNDFPRKIARNNM